MHGRCECAYIWACCSACLRACLPACLRARTQKVRGALVRMGVERIDLLSLQWEDLEQTSRCVQGHLHALHKLCTRCPFPFEAWSAVRTA